jgi:hypothetical protein
MPQTNNFSIPAASVQQVWVNMVASQMLPLSPLDASGIIGPGYESPVRDLSRMLAGNSGVTFNTPLRKHLTSGGVTDDNVMSGNEEAPVLSNNQGTCHIYKHAVGLPGEYEQAKTAISFRELFMDSMRDWGANRRMYDFIAEIKGSMTYVAQNNVLLPRGVANVGGITEDHKFSMQKIRDIRVAAIQKSFRRVTVPGFGQLIAVALLTPGQVGDLKDDPEYQALHHFSANRGPQNALFRNSAFFVDVISDVLLIECAAVDGMYGVDNSTHLYTEEAGDVTKDECIVMGGTACGYWLKRPPKAIHPDDTDYGNQVGHGMSMFYGFEKTVLNTGTIGAPVNKDFGIMYVPTAATIRIAVA